MPGRSTQSAIVNRYRVAVDEAHGRGDVQEEKRQLMEWVGTAKARLDKDQLVLVLTYIYQTLLNDPTATDFLFATYYRAGKIVTEETEENDGPMRLVQGKEPRKPLQLRSRKTQTP